MADSLIGFAPGTITDPPPPSASPIGFASGVIRDPHHPIGTFTDTGIVYHPILTWDGVELR